MIVTPFVVFLIYGVAYLVRPWVCDAVNARYFFPALTAKIVGAILLGLLYTFYYKGGDTFNFHTLGSRHIWEAFMDSPEKGLALIFSDGEHQGYFYDYSSKIYFFKDTASFFIVRLAAIFDLFTFSSYLATACFFAVIGFAGGWMMYLTFYRRYPHLHGWIAFAVLFVPSVVFWGSGLLKDTIMLACLGAIAYTVDQLFILKRFSVVSVVLLVLSVYVVFVVRKFMLQAFVPAAVLWIYYSRLISIRSVALRFLFFPLVIAVIGVLGYYSFIKIGEGDQRYSIEMLATTAKTTAYDIAFYSGRGAGSFYSLGELDGTMTGMLRMAPEAINVSLFRPYLWEVNNPLMTLSALESFCFLASLVVIILARRKNLLLALRNQDVVFLLVFTVIFAFAAGISSYNFGTLSRYRISLMPFFALALIIILNTRVKERPSSLHELE